MICQNCKNNDADVRIKSIIGGKACELALCHSCARILGYSDELPLNDVFSHIVNFAVNGIGGYTLTCDRCGATFDDIAKNGRVGCANCYNIFYDKLKPVLEKIHGNSEYQGKAPQGGEN